MEALLQSLSLGFLLRCIFAGAFGLVSLFTAEFHPNEFSKILEQDMAKLLPAALFGGAFAYILHRSLIYPWFEWALAAKRCCDWRTKFPLISDQTKAFLVRRWSRGAEKDNDTPREYAKHLATWADYAQLQYASALAIILGAILGAVRSKEPLEPNAPLIVLTIILVLAALVSDWRLRSIDEKCKARA